MMTETEKDNHREYDNILRKDKKYSLELKLVYHCMTSVCLLQLNTYCEGVLLMEIKARMNEETNLLGSRMLFRHTN